jgi:PPK2 family polyphosphate:nucleotide phosphotransferase
MPATPDFSSLLRFKPGKSRLKHFDPSETFGLKHDDHARAALEKNVKRLSEIQYRFYASNSRALLIVLQGMDAAGKDGTIRHVMTGLNPQGCEVTSFKKPTAEELDHDFLWRIHTAVPGKGEIGIFNRSHYEDVLVARVRKLTPKDVWKARYAQINAFEALLAGTGTLVLKFFLHISNAEQKERLQERLDDPAKNWKLNPQDFEERKLWNSYQEAYEDALAKCSTSDAPWFVIPANKKWFRNLAVSQIIVKTLEGLQLDLPKPPPGLDKFRL